MVSLRKAMDIARCARQDPLYGGIVFDCKPEEAFETVKVLRDEVVRLNDDLRAERMINLHAGPVLGPLKAEVERLRAVLAIIDNSHEPQVDTDLDSFTMGGLFCTEDDEPWPCHTHLLLHPEEASRAR